MSMKKLKNLRSSPTGPAEHWAGGSRPKSCNSYRQKKILHKSKLIYQTTRVDNTLKLAMNTAFSPSIYDARH